MEDIAGPSYKNFLRASQKNFHTSTAIAEHVQDLNARTSEGGFPSVWTHCLGNNYKNRFKKKKNIIHDNRQHIQ